MKLPVVMGLFCLSVNSCAQQNRLSMDSSPFLKKVFSVYGAIGLFENRFESTHDTKCQDSVFMYNDSLTHLLSKAELSNLPNADLRKIADSTQIRVCKSLDNRLKIVSWSVFESTPTALCSIIAVFDKNQPKILSSNGTTKEDSGPDIKVDTVIQLKQKGKFAYLLLGSNRCGNLCLDYMAVLCSVQNGEIFQKLNSFSDGKNFSNEVEFNYIINSKINKEPKFKIINNQLICPVFSSDGTRLIGKKNYKIIL